MKRLLQKVASAIRPGPAAPAWDHRPAAAHPVFVRIEESLMADRRMAKYQQPLHRALVRAHLGQVTGGGSVQGTDGAIQWISLQLELKDLDTALLFARGKLRDLGAPVGSTLKFKKGHHSVVVAVV